VARLVNLFTVADSAYSRMVHKESPLPNGPSQPQRKEVVNNVKRSEKKAPEASEKAKQDTEKAKSNTKKTKPDTETAKSETGTSIPKSAEASHGEQSDGKRQAKRTRNISVSSNTSKDHDRFSRSKRAKNGNDDGVGKKEGDNKEGGEETRKDSEQDTSEKKEDKKAEQKTEKGKERDTGDEKGDKGSCEPGPSK
jgi:hypothetical protein